METLHFSTTIQAPREKVWELLWNHDSYREWTAVFSEDSDVETDWKQGSKVYFHDGKGQGMVARIEETRAPEFLSFMHLGTVKDGVEDLESEAVKKWSGARENYTLKEINGGTELLIDMDTTDMKDYFLKTWPLALDKIKAMAENRN